MRDYRIGRACNRQFKEKLVAWVGKEWPDPEVNIRLAASETVGGHDRVDCCGRNPQSLRFTLSYCLVFEDEGHGDQGLAGFADPLEDGKGRSAPGPEGGNDDVGV